jgi:hypothetical protein
MPNRFIVYLGVYLVFDFLQFALAYSNLIDFLFYSFLGFVFLKEYLYAYQENLFSDSVDPIIPKYQELIVVGIYYDLVEAYLLLELLERNEIEATILGEMHGAVNPLIISALGGFQLQVAADQLDKAKEFVNVFNETHLMNPIISCPKCESSNVKEEYAWWPFSLLFVLLTKTPPPKKIMYRCNKCENEWGKLGDLGGEGDLSRPDISLQLTRRSLRCKSGQKAVRDFRNRSRFMSSMK